MNNRQRQADFLRLCLLYDDSSESDALSDRIRQLNSKERCVRRGMWSMVLMGVLAFAGLGYLAVFLDGFPAYMPGFMTWFITEVFCVLGLSSLICVAAFGVLGWIYRNELDERCEECRRLATKLFESRLGQPRTTTGFRR